MRLGNETIIVVHAALIVSTRDGSQGRDWGNATRTPYEGCMVEPYLMSNKLVQEDNMSREYVQGFYRCWLPPTAVVEHIDRLEWRGDSYEAFGPAQKWPDRRGVLHHVQVNMKFREG